MLSPENVSSVKEILREHNREEVLRAHGLRASDRLLLCGPPGCGKTLAAEVIVGEFGRPLAIVRTDSVVSSFLGETAANLRKVFDFVAASPMVALFDEFDALGKEREDASEHGELRRVVLALRYVPEVFGFTPEVGETGPTSGSASSRVRPQVVPRIPVRSTDRPR